MLHQISDKLNSVEQAAKHPITHQGPASDFFEGALMGNGGLGIVVTTRPDAVALHFGHNNVWDIRIAEEHTEDIGTFQEIYEKIMLISENNENLTSNPWFREYCEKMGQNYKKPYPRPMACGTLLLGFDRREAEVLGHRLDVSTGLCEVSFLVGDEKHKLQIVVEPDQDRVWMRMMNGQGEDTSSPFNRMRFILDPVASQDMPKAEFSSEYHTHTLSFKQRLPYGERWKEMSGQPDKDKAFRLSARTSCTLSIKDEVDLYAGVHTGGDDPISDAQLRMDTLDAIIADHNQFIACIQLDEGLSVEITPSCPELPTPASDRFHEASNLTRKKLDDFWNRSGVALEDEFLERVWYRNLYFFYCSVKPGVTCPGIYGNWCYMKVGSVWHGDYHLDYNTQQPFWVAFSSNHIDRHEPYVDMIDHIMGVSKKWAKEYYGLRGAYIPVSVYPLEMKTNPYPVPTWGWQTCVTPWAVQSLWWHYTYTLDVDFLRDRAFGPIKEAVLFMVDYMNRPEAFGEQWGDDKHHIFPTVTPELYGLTTGFKMNADCLVTLTLTKFAFGAYLQACQILQVEYEERELTDQVEYLLQHFPDYPKSQSVKHGEVFVSVPGENPEIVYNVPNSCMPVFPGEEFGLHSTQAEYELSVRSYRNQQVEGGNELVFYHLQGARLGVLDIEKFKRRIQYCLLPNGTCADMVLQTGGRYDDSLAFDFMANMGIWVENFALPVVINECLLQSYTGILRFFPNWPKQQDAAYATLRAVGGFLVSASLKDGHVQWIEIISEQGSGLQLYNPWAGKVIVTSSSGKNVLEGEIISLKTDKGESLRFEADLT
ncbi:glycosyl hydrolase family 95 catalytic domain-containing protein [Paenibacillus sp. Soil787]|uniref:glycosyl hydrolase family 95 catalytic domain-containing protein n=1 Tax=Paenibacillus sp. Soil787 TaxID=1736411 RepID=UPI0007029385|nr:glycoside hydrolase N-terminal domain-containing protein [Paenibacillus sp. Soil787]KRF18415.1 hypothetical protein ASG93_10160 [Paenibacillus sp. Soil787]